MAKSKKPKKERDPLQNLKYKGYCWANTPPGENSSFEDFVNFARFTLCKKTNRLWKDPIWETYTEEEILIEYFAHLFATDEDARKKFEVQMDAGSDVYGEDVFEWLDKKVKENQQEMEKKLEELPEKITFSPDKDTEE